MTMKEKIGQKTKSRPKKWHMPLLLLLLLLVCAAIWHFAHQTVRPTDVDLGESGFDVAIDEDVAKINEAEGKEEIQNELNRQVADGMINISMNMRPVFDTGTSTGNLMIANENTNSHMQIVEIYRDDTGKLIYHSGGIPVGSEIDLAALDVSLEKGVYPCTAYFNAVDEDTGALLGKAGAKIEITILN